MFAIVDYWEDQEYNAYHAEIVRISKDKGKLEEQMKQRTTYGVNNMCILEIPIDEEFDATIMIKELGLYDTT